MNEEDSILAEINYSIEHYEKKAVYYRRLSIFIKVLEFLIALSMLPVIYFDQQLHADIKIIFWILGSTLVLLIFFSLVFNVDGKYSSCKLLIKDLLSEKHLFMNRAGVYDNTRASTLLIQRFDEIRSERLK